MFGYIRPLQGELKVYELERFKACYCGLCHTLGKKYGFITKFTLSYELVFLSMLLWDTNEPPVIKRKRCIASPCKRRRCAAQSPSLEVSAGITVILTWWKLRDTISDESFIKSIPHRLAALVLSSAFKKAVRDFPVFADKVQSELTKLAENEFYKSESLDESADKFANILCAAVSMDASDPVRRSLLELLYHLGRWIYIIDACDDFEDDVKSGSFNPISAEYPPVGNRLPEDGAEALKTTLTHSNNLVCLAFELLPENTWSDIIRNMIYLGMPEMTNRILGV